MKRYLLVIKEPLQEYIIFLRNRYVLGSLILNSYIEENSYSLGFYIFSQMLIVQAIYFLLQGFIRFKECLGDGLLIFLCSTTD
jgi:hypothetical protein